MKSTKSVVPLRPTDIAFIVYEADGGERGYPQFVELHRTMLRVLAPVLSGRKAPGECRCEGDDPDWCEKAGCELSLWSKWELVICDAYRGRYTHGMGRQMDISREASKIFWSATGISATGTDHFVLLQDAMRFPSGVLKSMGIEDPVTFSSAYQRERTGKLLAQISSAFQEDQPPKNHEGHGGNR